MCPAYIPHFIAEYLKDLAPKRILDPWAGIGSLLLPIVQHLHPTRAVGISLNPAEIRLARLLDANGIVEWQIGDPLGMLEPQGEPIDAVLSWPPMGLPPTTLTLAGSDGPVTLRAAKEELVALKAATLLGDGGVAFFVVRRGYLGSKVREVFPQFGLCLDAVLELPPDAAAPAASVSCLLIRVRRDRTEHLFVAKLSSDPKAQGVLLQNLRRGVAGKSPELGAIVEPQLFHTVDALSAQQRLERYARFNSLQGVTLGGDHDRDQCVF